MAQSFTQLYFGKPIDDVDPNDLIEFFSEERPEGISIEFKSFAQHEGDIKYKIKGVLRTICAFLNSEGGLLIWGAPEGKKNSQNEKVFTGALSPVTTYYSKDNFISRLTSQIKDIPIGIRFRDIKVGNNEYVYLIDVPESEFKPHQVENNYHYRYDGQTQIAPHFLVRALFNQVRRPILYAYLEAETTSVIKGRQNPLYVFDYICINFSGLIYNRSEIINDKNIFYRIKASRGTFANPVNYSEITEIINTSAALILPAGIPANFSLMLYISANEVAGTYNSKMLKLELSVGGELSAPLKQTYEYFIQILVDHDDSVGEAHLSPLSTNPKKPDHATLL